MPGTTRIVPVAHISREMHTLGIFLLDVTVR